MKLNEIKSLLLEECPPEQPLAVQLSESAIKFILRGIKAEALKTAATLDGKANEKKIEAAWGQLNAMDSILMELLSMGKSGYHRAARPDLIELHEKVWDEEVSLLINTLEAKEKELWAQ